MPDRRPSPIALFALYHLGLDEKGRYQFRNLAECARQLRVDAGQLQQWLRQAGLDADAVKSVPYNLTRRHVDAQFVAAGEADALIRQAWAEFQMARQQMRGGRGQFHHDVNYDDIWGDGYSAPDADKP